MSSIKNTNQQAQGQLQGQLQGIVGSGNSSVSISTKGTVGDVKGGSSSVKNSGNNYVSTEGTVGDVKGGSVSVAEGAIKVGCVVNCSDQSGAAREAGDADIRVALINAQAARDVAATTQVIKNTPSVSGPNLTTSNDTCMGSTSGSVNIAGLGIGGGSSWVDANCKMLKNSRELWNMGMKAASLALMCTDTANKEALELTGYVCPQTEKANADAKKVANTTPTEYTDPIVRARLGLAALTASAK